MFSKYISVLTYWLISKIDDRIKRFTKWRRDIEKPSFMLDQSIPSGGINRIIPPPNDVILDGNWDWLRDICVHYLNHRFDLLGSGPVKVYHGMVCRGLEGYRYEAAEKVVPDRKGEWLVGRINPANLKESQRIWGLIGPDYTPIDWQLDFKSGYRWRENVWYRDIKFGHLLGVDVKVPWELGRMQHLPHLAWAYGHAQRGMDGFDKPQRYLKEFRNQVLDFIATNPPRWGVNWACTMDVAIRIANWLVAHDLFKAFGAQFDDEFEKVFHRSVYEHGRHIIENLEWSPKFRSNHYLANIVGLLFVSVYLPCNRETNAWLAFSVQELIKEVKNQFNEDGSNFEASTSYHRLSAELVIYAMALAVGLSEEKRQALKNYDHTVINRLPKLAPPPLPTYPLSRAQGASPFPDWYLLRVERMGEFTMQISKPNHHVPQIGDNDSGRFLKLFPAYRKMTIGEAKARYANLRDYNELPDDQIYWMEDVLDHRHLVAAINGLLDRVDFAAFAGDVAGLETKMIAALSRGVKVDSTHHRRNTNDATYSEIYIGEQTNYKQLASQLSKRSASILVTQFPARNSGLRDDLRTIAFPDFGLYLFRSKRFYLAVRCGLSGREYLGGHAHNDQLTIELMIDGETLLVDPGTYLYTPIPQKRNAYRSVRAHFTPQVDGKEPGNFSKGLFRNGGNPKAQVLYFGKEGFIGTHVGFGFPVFRQIVIEDSSVIVKDISIKDELLQIRPRTVPFSPGYGVVEIETNA